MPLLPADMTTIMPASTARLTAANVSAGIPSSSPKDMLMIFAPLIRARSMATGKAESRKQSLVPGLQPAGSPTLSDRIVAS